MASLNSAIQLIREGRKDEARHILETLLRAEPSNVQAWFWYVDTCPTHEKRIQVLEVCLKMNPGNAQVVQALQTLRGHQPSQPVFTPPPAPAPKPSITYDPQPYSALYDDEPEAPARSVPAFNDYGYKPSDTPYAEQSSEKKKNAWEEDFSSYVDNSMLSKHSKPRPAAKSHAFYEVWITALAMLDFEAYGNALNDPEAGAGRAFEWMGYAGIVGGLIIGLTLPLDPRFSELENMPGFMGLFGYNTAIFAVMFALAMALLMPIISIIGLAITAGIQNFLAGFMGGIGDYGRTIYALAAYMAPMVILSAVFNAIPVAGQCLTSFLGIYNLVLNARALSAAHSLSTGKAIAVIFLPSILIFIFTCVILLAIGFPAGSG